MSVTLMTETNLYKDGAIADGLEDASKVATNYLSYNQQDGLSVGRTGQSERAVITSDGMEIYDGLNNQIAQFKSVTRIGLEDEGYLQMDYHSLQLKDIDGNAYVYFSDTRNHSRYTVIEETEEVTTAPVSAYFHYFTYPINSSSDVLEMQVNNADVTNYTFYLNSDHQVVSVAIRSPLPSLGDTVYIKYQTDVPIRAFTLGSREADSFLGIDSFVSGSECLASGIQSQAFGSQCKAIGSFAHAFGRKCIASGSSGSIAGGNESEAYGQSSIALGFNCVAESGSFTAIQASYAKGNSVAMGLCCNANNYYSVAIGSYLDADGRNQCVLGTYNNSNSSSLFIIGCGTSSQRKNALTLSMAGDMIISGTFNQSSDKRLKHHRAYLSDQQDQVNEFINRLKPAWFEKDEQKHLGFYAQDVQQTDRWQCMVDNDTNGYLTLGYTELLAPLVAYCQNLEQKVESLEQRIERLEQLLNQQ